MSIWLQRRRMAIFCSLILFLCVFLFVTGVTGQQSTMAQQGWSPEIITLSVLGASNIILNFVLLWRSYQQKPKVGSRTMDEEPLLRTNTENQKEKEQLEQMRAEDQKEKGLLQDLIAENQKEKGLLQDLIAENQKEKEQLEQMRAENQKEKGLLQDLIAQLKELIEFLKKQRHEEDVTLDPDTAHPRLEISDDGKSVKDTGTIKTVPNNEKRFDSHTFVLAKEGYTSGRHCWEVDVGKRRSWVLGIARESVTRKGTLTLSPKNGLWVMGCTDGREYWAYTEPWTRLSVGGKLRKIRIFLDISSKQLSFYNVRKKAALYTFTVGGESSQKEKFFPFFSTGTATAKPDEVPLKIVWMFDDDDE